jgi:hypothetical protein
MLANPLAAWPIAAHAQQPEKMRRIAVPSNAAADSPDDQARLAVFRTDLEQLGWSDGGNMRIDYRWSATILPTRAAMASGTFAARSRATRPTPRRRAKRGRLSGTANRTSRHFKKCLPFTPVREHPRNGGRHDFALR